jgi:hypothetical protein
MDTQQRRRLLDDIGGEPLEGPGFEGETSAFEEEFEPEADQQEDGQ